MSKKYISQIMSVLSKPPGTRPDHETRPVANWLRSKVRYFKEAPDAAMFKLVSECGVETKCEDEIIILEGDVGDRMYIVLSGTVDIHRYNESDKADDPELPEDRPVGQTMFHDRTPLGQMIANNLPLGIIFGEIALIEDCPRTASVVCSSPEVQIAVVPRDLYNSTVRAMIEKEYQFKRDFVNRMPYFSACQPRFKKQLLMALDTQYYDYESEICHQCDSLKSIYFVVTGEVRLYCDPSLQYHQYVNKLKEEDKAILDGFKNKQEQINVSRPTRILDICLMGTGENNGNVGCFGDAEAILGFNSYMYSAMATMKTSIIGLSMRHVDRYIFKRNVYASDRMREDCATRFTTWVDRFNNVVPVFRYTLLKLQEGIKPQVTFNLTPSTSTGGGLTDLTSRNRRAKSQQSRESFSSFSLPPRGPLIDIFAPGTVFAHIRTQFERRIKMNANSRRYNPNPFKSIKGKDSREIHSAVYATMTAAEVAQMEAMELQGDDEDDRVDVDTQKFPQLSSANYMTAAQSRLAAYDTRSSLESRLTKFMTDISDNSKNTIRVQSLAAYKLTEDKEPPKAGSVIILRPVSKLIMADIDQLGSSNRTRDDMLFDIKRKSLESAKNQKAFLLE